MDRQGDPLASIVVPVYNVAPYVKECIESLQRQSYQNIEVIVVDDGSTDGSGDICREAASRDRRVKVVRQENKGVAAARGTGIRHAAGEYLMFVDGDDWVEPGMAGALIKHASHAGLVTSGVYCQDGAGRETERHDEFPEGVYSGEGQVGGILKKMIYDEGRERVQRLTPWCYNKLYHCRLAKEVYQGMDQSIAFAEDTVFLYKYLLRCQSVAIIHGCYYHYRFREGSAVHTANSHMLEQINKVYLALLPDFESHRLREALLFQLQKWAASLCIWAVNSHMGFKQQAHTTEFIADLSGMEGKRVALYGAGQAGQDTYKQMGRFGHEVALWADKNYRLCQEKGMPVEAPEKLLDGGYDLIYIAAGSQGLAEEMRRYLLGMGIPEGHLVWRKPMRV